MTLPTTIAAMIPPLKAVTAVLYALDADIRLEYAD